jgi:hypothetical protein
MALQYHLALYMRMNSKCVRQFYGLQQRLDSSTNNPLGCNIVGKDSEPVKNSDML